MEWSQSTLLSLARLSCVLCGGNGINLKNEGEIVPCSCVLRAIFRACYARFRACVQRKGSTSCISFDHFGGKERRLMCGRKEEEYAADFHLVGRRVLDPFHYRVFSSHYLLGADWKLCCRRLGLDRGIFFHAVYRVQETLGRVFYELEPYALYPPREYFSTRLESRPPSRASFAAVRLVLARAEGGRPLVAAGK